MSQCICPVLLLFFPPPPPPLPLLFLSYCAGLRPVPPIRGAVDDDDDSVDDGHDGHDEVDGDVEYATVDDDAGDGEGGV